MLTAVCTMSDDKPLARQFGIFAVAVTDLIGLTGAGVGLGWWLWAKVGFPWWILLITSGAGLSLAMVRVYKLSRKL